MQQTLTRLGVATVPASSAMDAEELALAVAVVVAQSHAFEEFEKRCAEAKIQVARDDAVLQTLKRFGAATAPASSAMDVEELVLAVEVVETQPHGFYR